MPSELSRGGRKLEAAFAAFDLGSRVRGARAIDVGASTGGFATVLLARGAAHVTAIDVGHGQLAPALARDERVTSLEGTDFKTLSLAIAPGPFDFFTVDVSFVAGRSMLRGLAFRLRAGAEGVVLVKPQFELPGGLVRDGKVDTPVLRQRALGSFIAKAERLGFTVLAWRDSPVAGGSGTVEILAHLRFAGRPESMPRPGERKPGRTPPRPSHPAAPTRDFHWFAVAAPGLEGPLGAELSSLPGLEGVREVEGGAEFSGPLAAGMAANLWSRIATRVLLRLGEVRARDFAPLRRGLAKLPWASFVPGDRPLRVDASASHCRLYHTGALAETVALAVEDCVGAGAIHESPLRGLPAESASPEFRHRAGSPDPSHEETPLTRLAALGDLSPLPRGEVVSGQDSSFTRILLRGQDDRFVASIDSSGALLHRRGWRLEAGPAPLRETLAAGILALAGYRPGLPLVDPMCGSGTFAIEAAGLALGRAPGAGRSFAFERWPMHDAVAWRNLRAAGAAKVSTALVLASDRDPAAVEVARRNAARAGVDQAVRFVVATFAEAEVPSPPGLVVINPPYGRRLGQRGPVLRLARDIGGTLAARFPGWRAAILCPDARFVAAVATAARRRPTATLPLRNGGLRVELALFG